MKSSFAAAGLILLSMGSCTKEGGHWQHYRISALTEAKDRQMTIFLHFDQNENETCRKQKAELDSIITDPKYKKVGAYRITYGTEKGLEQMFNVKEPCTLLVLKGAFEKGRAVKETDARLLSRLFSQGL